MSSRRAVEDMTAEGEAVMARSGGRCEEAREEKCERGRMLGRRGSSRRTRRRGD